MQRQAVDSSFITEVGHDPDTQTMEIKFRNGTLERHENVSVEDHAAFVGAESIGKHWNANLKGRGTRLDPVEHA